MRNRMTVVVTMVFGLLLNGPRTNRLSRYTHSGASSFLTTPPANML